VHTDSCRFRPRVISVQPTPRDSRFAGMGRFRVEQSYMLEADSGVKVVLMQCTLRRIHLVAVAACMMALGAAADYSSDPDYRTVIRTPDLVEQPVGQAITVTAVLVNSGPSAVRGFYYADHLPSELDVSTVAVTVDGTATTDYTYEVGYIGEVYQGMRTHRWVLETPPGFDEGQPVTSTCTVVYEVTGSTAGLYALPGYTWAGYDTDVQIGVFGYETNPPVFEFTDSGNSFGTVYVDITPDAASWTVIDGNGGEHAGTGDMVLTDMPTGSVRIDYDPLTGYLMPSFQTDTLTEDGSVTFSAVYTRQTGTIAVDVTPTSASWIVTDGDSSTHAGAGGQTLTDIPTGSVRIDYDPLPGYETPAYETANLTSGGLVAFSGTYIRETGTVVVDVTPESASWTVIDGDGGEHSGTGDATLDDMPTGTVHIHFDPLADYLSPQVSSRVLTSNGTVDFSGVYVYAAPTATVDWPEANFDLATSSSVDIIGTAQDSDDDISDFMWLLDRSEGPLPSTTWVLLATGTQNVVEATLAVWDHQYGLAPGQYICRLRCVNQFGSSSAERVFDNNLSPPGIPSDPMPSSGSENVISLESLVWQCGEQTNRCYVYLWAATDPRPDDPTATVTGSGPWYLPGALDPYTQYNWQIVAANGAGSTEGPVWSFTTDDSSPPSRPGQPIPQCAFIVSATYPAGRYYQAGFKTAFTWTPAADGESGIETYHFRAGTVPGAADVYDSDIGDVVEFAVSAQYGQTVYARVAACNGDGAWSEYSQSSAPVRLMMPSLDPDGDGILTGLELGSYGTDPTLADTDGDRLSDGYETEVSLTDPTDADSDGDGIPDSDEDPDGDGFANLDECRAGRLPNDPRSRPTTLRVTDAEGRTVSSCSMGEDQICAEVDQPAQNKNALVRETVTVTVRNTATGDMETLVLTETDVSSGMFFATAGLATQEAASAVPHDGRLQSEFRSLAVVVYTDPDVPSDTVAGSVHMRYPLVDVHGTPAGSLWSPAALALIMVFVECSVRLRRCNRTA